MRVPPPVAAAWKAWTAVMGAVGGAVVWCLFLLVYAAVVVPASWVAASGDEARPGGRWRPLGPLTRTLEDARRQS